MGGRGRRYLGRPRRWGEKETIPRPAQEVGETGDHTSASPGGGGRKTIPQPAQVVGEEGDDISVRGDTSAQEMGEEGDISVQEMGKRETSRFGRWGKRETIPRPAQKVGEEGDHISVQEMGGRGRQLGPGDGGRGRLPRPAQKGGRRRRRYWPRPRWGKRETIPTLHCFWSLPLRMTDFARLR